MKHATKISEQGNFRVVVPDLYKGKRGANAEEAHHLMSNLDFPAAIDEISKVAAWLKTTGSSSVGIVGFCMGGAVSMGALAASPDISLGASFYGVNFGLFDNEALANKPVQVSIHFALKKKFFKGPLS